MFHDREVSSKINRLHERALRIVYNDDLSTFDELLEKDGEFKIHERNVQLLAIEMYEAKNDIGLEIMNDMFQEKEKISTKLKTQSEFQISRSRTVHVGHGSLRNLGPLIWNIAPSDLKNSSTLNSFRENIKKMAAKPMPLPIMQTLHTGGWLLNFYLKLYCN